MTGSELALAAIERGATQKQAELAALIDVLRAELPPDPTILEIGCDQGGTLFVWTRLAEHVVGIDLPSGRQLIDHGAEVIVGDSHDPAILPYVHDALGGYPVDFLFIDGDHSYEGVRLDWENFGPLVRQGGLVAFHDICRHSDPAYKGEIAVDRLWAEIRRSAACEFICEPTTWGGIGLLRV